MLKSLLHRFAVKEVTKHGHDVFTEGVSYLIVGVPEEDGGEIRARLVWDVEKAVLHAMCSDRIGLWVSVFDRNFQLKASSGPYGETPLPGYREHWQNAKRILFGDVVN